MINPNTRIVRNTVRAIMIIYHRATMRQYDRNIAIALSHYGTVVIALSHCRHRIIALSPSHYRTPAFALSHCRLSPSGTHAHIVFCLQLDTLNFFTVLLYFVTVRVFVILFNRHYRTIAIASSYYPSDRKSCLSHKSKSMRQSNETLQECWPSYVDVHLIFRSWSQSITAELFPLILLPKRKTYHKTQNVYEVQHLTSCYKGEKGVSGQKIFVSSFICFYKCNDTYYIIYATCSYELCARFRRFHQRIISPNHRPVLQ